MKGASALRSFAKTAVTRSLEFEFEKMPYRLEAIPLRKLAVIARSKIDTRNPRPGRPWYPTKLQIEVSSACTLRCPLCPSGMGVTSGPRTNMTFPVFRDLIDETGGHAVIAVFWMWGEPLLNPKLPEMISYARSKGVGTVVSTNGQHMQTREEAERFVASAPDNLVIALDGATQEVYSRYRVGGDIAKILRCLELVCEVKRTLGVDKPFVNVRTVVMKHNEHELRDIAEIARRYGANMVSRKTAFLPDYYSAEDPDESFLPSDPRYRRFRYSDGKRIKPATSEFHCRRPWDRMTVCADGTVLACEFDFNRTAPFGQGGNGKSFMDAWWSPEADEFRRRFLKDRTAYKFCKECHFRDRRDNVCTVEAECLR